LWDTATDLERAARLERAHALGRRGDALS